MHFVVHCTDKPGHLAVRQANRPAHVEFLKANAAAIPVAGPYLADNGDMIGSMLIVSAADKPAAEALLAQDPYAAAGLFDSVTVTPWKWVIGAPV